MDVNLENKRALVCGSTRGIGKAIAMEVAELGAHVTLVARNEKALPSVAQSLPRNHGQTHQWMAVDFANPQELEKKLNSYVREFPATHILVNNTGGPPAGAVFAAKPEEFVDAFAKHVLCNQTLVQALVPGMKKEKYGRIINIISTSVKQPIPELGVSNTIRAAVANWAKTLATELGSFGVTVNNILPGYTDTERLQSLFEHGAKKKGISVEKVKAEAIKSIPAGRLALPKEIAYAVAFLASPYAAYINGINLPVDGGRTGCL